MAKTFFTSDQHFGHARIIELCGRPFADVVEMGEVLIARWNEVVGEEDVVWCLGDLAMGSFAESVAQTSRLRGKKRLIPGNHDRVHSSYKGSAAKKAEWRKAYEEAGWEIYPEVWGVLLGRVALCHFPYEGDSHGEDRYKEYRPVNDGRWLIHGHVHGSWKVREKQINVGVDVWDFRPVALEEIAEICNGG